MNILTGPLYEYKKLLNNQLGGLSDSKDFFANYIENIINNNRKFITTEEFKKYLDFILKYKEEVENIKKEIENINLEDLQNLENKIDSFSKMFHDQYLETIGKHDINVLINKITSNPIFFSNLKKTKKNINKLNNHFILLNYIFDYGLAFLGEKIKKEIDINKILDTLKENKSSSENLILNIECSENIGKVLGNPGDLYFLLDNIIKNAEKHGKATKVEIKVKEEQNKLLIGVIDNGEGIKGFGNNIRDIFKKGISGGGSTGLGIANADRRIEEIGGTIKVEKNGGLNGGAKFVLELPIIQEAKKN